MKIFVFGLIGLLGILGCQENDASKTLTPIELGLPEWGAVDECGPGIPISGGDMMDLADRVVVGEVTSIAFVEELTKTLGGVPTEGECNPWSYYWRLKVTLKVTRNLKGTGEFLEVYVSPDELHWASVPMRNVNGTWLPDFPGHMPAVQLSDELAWSEMSGIQVGQTLLLFAIEDQLGNSRTVVPWAMQEDGTFTFQYPDTDCYAYPVPLSTPFTETELVEELNAAPMHDFSTRRETLKMNPTPLVSWCMLGNPEDFVVDSGDMN